MNNMNESRSVTIFHKITDQWPQKGILCAELCFPRDLYVNIIAVFLTRLNLNFKYSCFKLLPMYF
jgi:hypothetical protein